MCDDDDSGDSGDTRRPCLDGDNELSDSDGDTELYELADSLDDDDDDEETFSITPFVVLSLNIKLTYFGINTRIIIDAIANTN